MFKKIHLLFLLTLSSCTIKAGNIPENKNPDIVDRYYEGGYSILDGKIGSEKLSIPDFATKLCKDRGFENGYSGYEIDRGTTSRSTNIFITLENSSYKDIKVWCKR